MPTSKPNLPICLYKQFEKRPFRILYDHHKKPTKSQVLFVLKDLCAILDYKNHRMAAKRHLDPQDVTKRYVLDANNHRQQTLVVTESGLYALIFGSKRPQAKAFKHYVTSQVLPSVRKYGAYMSPKVLNQVMADPQACAELLASLRQTLMEKNALEKQLTQATAKITYAEAVGDSRGTISMYAMAALLRTAGLSAMTREKLMANLRTLGYLSVQPGSLNHPKASAKGLIKLCMRVIWPKDDAGQRLPNKGPFVFPAPRLTGQGQIYFMNLFLSLVGKEAVH